jgi:hypothetical protein
MTDTTTYVFVNGPAHGRVMACNHYAWRVIGYNGRQRYDVVYTVRKYVIGYGKLIRVMVPSTSLLDPTHTQLVEALALAAGLDVVAAAAGVAVTDE